MRHNLPTESPLDRGFTSAESLVLFGMASNATHFDEALRSDGLDEQTRHRFDTRHELQAPLELVKHHLSQHPDRYLRYQTYLDPYPAARTSAYD